MTACIIWHGGRSGRGYGNASGVLAHRHVWTECFGPIPAGHVVHHRCGVRPCVNPEHLEVMTHAEHSRLHDNPRRAREAMRAATVCKHGHGFTKENTAWTRTGQRRCRACDRARYHRRKAMR